MFKILFPITYYMESDRADRLPGKGITNVHLRKPYRHMQVNGRPHGKARTLFMVADILTT